MRTLNLPQGSPEWLAHRRTTRNASDAPAMMGVSPYVTRSELVRQYATGIQRDVDAATQARFDRGHEVEPALRALAEGLIGEALYPVTGVSDDGYLGASFDGVTLLEDVIFEAKQTNAEKMAMVRQGQIPPQDYWQVVQQFAVCESADRCFYLVGDGVVNTEYLEILREQVAGDIPKLLAAWKQFDADVAAYQPETSATAAVGQMPDQLPALSVVARGMVEFSNLQEFREQAMTAISKVNRNLQTDDDFATAELTIKAFKAGEERLEVTKSQILGQMADVDAVMRTIDEVSAELRRVRLDLDKQVKVEKENRKADIVQGGAKAVRAHFDTLNESLGEHRIQPPQSLVMDLGAAIKGKKSLASMKDAVDTAVAGFKIAASEQAERVRANVRVLEMEQGSHGVLFPDRVVLCATKTPEDLRNLITARIAQAKADQEKRDEEKRQREADEAARRESLGNVAAGAAPAPTAAFTAASGTAQSAATGGVTSMNEPAGNSGKFAAGARIKLGDINARIAPLTITADGLRQLGFEPAGRDRSATLYREADLPHMCHAMAKVLEQATHKKAA